MEVKYPLDATWEVDLSPRTIIRLEGGIFLCRRLDADDVPEGQLLRASMRAQRAGHGHMIGEMYRHYKQGNIYEVLQVAHELIGAKWTPVVVYQRFGPGTERIWARLLLNFEEHVTVPRFSRLTP